MEMKVVVDLSWVGRSVGMSVVVVHKRFGSVRGQW